MATDKVPLARSASTTAYSATMAEIATWANTNLPVASTTTAGVVKVDGSSVTISSGVISSVSPAPYGSLPAMDGTAAAGAVSAWSRGDHVHPSDTSRAPLASPPFTGTPTAPTPTTGDNSTKLATTAFVQAQMVASGAGVSSWNSRAGAVVLQQSDLVAQGDFHDTGRNLVMNGAFAVAQRGTGPWTTSTYTADRWLSAIATDTTSFTIATLADADRTAIGDETARFALQTLYTGNAAAGALTYITQPIESARRLSGKTVTVSFYAKATSGTPKLGVNMSQVFGTGGSPSAGLWALATGQATPALTATFTRYSFTIAMPSTAGKAFGTNGDDYTGIVLWYSSGATNNASAGNIGVQSGTVQIWGVQVEIGSVATPFDAGGTPQQILAQCQRFYQVITGWAGAGYTGGAYVIQAMVPLLAPMRASPTLVPTWGTNTNISTPSASYNGAAGVLLSGNTSASGQWGINLTALTASADL